MRARLALVAAAVTVMVALSFLIPLARLVDQLAADRALTQAERDAQLVAQFVGVASATLGAEQAFASVTSSGTLGGREASLLLGDGRVIGAPATPSEDLSAALTGAAIRVDTTGGQVVAVPSVAATGDVSVVRVFVSDEELDRGVARSWFLLGLLGLTLVAIATAVTDRLGRSMVAPVEDLSGAADELGRGNLAVRVTPTGPPELTAVGREFNRLADRVAALLQRERETAADLSHRLRTPLAAARLDAEAMTPGEDRDRILADLDEVDRTVTHIIRLARRELDPATGASDIVATVENRFEFWGALADEQNRVTELAAPPGPLWVGLDETDLAATLDALFGNVLAHTEPGTAYRVELQQDGGSIRLTVDDDGPGFADPGLLERGESTADSTGLGLDIVRRHVVDAGGEVTIANRGGGGARIVLELPVVEAPIDRHEPMR